MQLGSMPDLSGICRVTPERMAIVQNTDQAKMQDRSFRLRLWGLVFRQVAR